jgi:hypothetical protein
MIDLNAYVGRWPFGPVKPDTTSGLLRLMDRAGIERAAVTPFEALLYKDPMDANRLLARAVKNHGDRLLPFATLNPALPDWPGDLRAVTDLGARGLRLFPSYHGYALEDPPCGELLEAAAESGIPVQVVPAISDPRMHHPRAMAPSTPLAVIPVLLRRIARLRLCVLNASAAPIAKDLETLRRSRSFFRDIAWADGIACLDPLAQQYGRDALVFGSSMPLLPRESASYKLREIDWDDAAMAALTEANARRFLGEQP